MSIKHVMSVKDDHTTMSVVPQPGNWFSLQDHVSDSMVSRTLCRVSGGNVGLGNQFRNKFNKKFNVCPSRAALGIRVKLRESHVLFVCPTVIRLQVSYGLAGFRNNAVQSGILTTQGVLRHYLVGDGVDKMILWARAKCMGKILSSWLQTVHADTALL